MCCLCLPLAAGVGLLLSVVPRLLCGVLVLTAVGVEGALPLFSLAGLPSPGSGLMGDLGLASPRDLGDDLKMGDFVSGM